MAKWRNWLYCGITAVLVFLFIRYWDICFSFVLLAVRAAVPLLIGCVIAYLVNILMCFYERHWTIKKPQAGIHRFRRPLCILLSFITVILVLFIVFNMIIPELQACVLLLMKELPPFIEMLLEKAEELFTFYPQIIDELQNALHTLDWETVIKKAVSLLTTGLGDVVTVAVSVISSVISVIATLVVGLIFSLYLLTGKERLGAQFHRLITTYLRPKYSDRIFYVLRVLDNAFHKFIVGQCTESVILGLLCIGGMMLLRLPYATMVGTLIGFTALIPIAGAFIGAVVGTFMIFTVSPVKAVVFLVFFLILQQVEGNIIYPKVVGSSMGLPGIWVLAAITIGGGVMGIWGMLLGVPLAAALYQLLRNDINRRSGN